MRRIATAAIGLFLATAPFTASAGSDPDDSSPLANADPPSEIEPAAPTAPVGGNDIPTEAESAAQAMPGGVPVDRAETAAEVPPSTVEVMTLDSESMPAPGVHIELVRDRQSVAEGNSSTKWEAISDSSGHAMFTGIPSGSDSQYRVTVAGAAARYGTPFFPLDGRAGKRVVFHVYPLASRISETLIVGRAMVFVEPRDDVLSIEFLQEFRNIGRNVMIADSLTLDLPKGWKAFATNPTDNDLSATRIETGVALAGVIAPGQHAVAFTFQFPKSNHSSLDLDLNLWPNTAQAQVATLARPGLQLAVEGFPNPTLTQGNARQPVLVTGRSFARDDGSTGPLHLRLAGLPVIGPGRWVASAVAALLALWAILAAVRGRSARPRDSHEAAKERILHELVDLETARREGQVGGETYASTRELLLSAFVRIERDLLTNYLK
jgi:hypothetical protein